MNHLSFYVEHAIRDMTRNGRRTAFALFCIAAGVAAIVALRSLSLMIADSPAGNFAAINHGDLNVQARGSEGGGFSLGSGGTRIEFSADAVQRIQSWADANNIQTTGVVTNANIQVTPLDNAQNAGRPQFIDSYVIDPAVYPFYTNVVALDPAGVPLSKLFTGGNDVVISKNLADNNKIKVGDQVRVGRTTEKFTVRGIVPTETEGNLRNLLASFFGFAYFDKAQNAVLQLDNLPDEIPMKAPQGADVTALKQSLQSQVSGLEITTTADVRKQNQTISDIIDRLIIVMGLAALLIGGTGIIHTMLVVVSRRTTEIAVLKTVGLKARQITLMFLVESIIMGVFGSLLGVLLGIVFSLGVRSFTQNVWPQALTWQLYPQAMLTGVVLGVVITTIFGFLPTLTAAAVRPASVLRPNESILPRTGCVQSGLAILLVVIAVGLVAGQLVGNLLVGLIGIAAASLILLIIVGLLYVLIALVGVLPSFGSVDLKLALRGIGTHRARTASTLLALLVGIFSLSVITLMADSIPRLLNFQLTNLLGGNVLVFTPLQLLQPLVIGQLKGKPGVLSYSELGDYTGKLVAVNGSTDFLKSVPSVNKPVQGFGPGGQRNMTSQDVLQQQLGNISILDVTSPQLTAPDVTEGRTLNAQDSGQRNIVLRPNPMSLEIGLKVGDKVTVQINNQPLTFTIVGLEAQPTSSFGANSITSFAPFTAPADAFPSGMSPSVQFTIASVDEAHLNQVLVNLTSIPGIFAFDVGFFETLIKRLLDEFTAIPTIVAVLSLFAGAVIIANTVSLSTLERRRQVGVMKAIGLKGQRVLAQMVLENGIIGLLGGLLGVGIGVIATLLLSINSSIPVTQSISWGTVIILLSLSLVISLVATLLSAWTAATEKPLNVLRYE